MSKSINKVFISLFLCLLIVFSSIAFSFKPVSADVNKKTSVLQDLCKDENFNINNYPKKLDDFSMDVIHLAEGSSGAVYIYVYQPSGSDRTIVAKGISMCTKDYTKYYTADNPAYNNMPLFVIYDLVLISNKGTLFKYEIKDYNYKEDLNFYTGGEFDRTLARNYEISTIYRPYQEGETPLDEEALHSEKGLEVGKCFTVTSLLDGTSNVSIEMVDVISITDKFVGSIRYDQGYYIIFDEDVDSWFVSFSTDKKMENLLEVDIYYNCTDILKVRPSRFTLFGRLVDLIVGNYNEFVSDSSVLQTITVKDEGTYGGGWFVDEKGFKRIVPVDEFLINDGSVFSEDTKSEILKHDWVCRFVETSVTETHYSEISNVSLLRFQFETSGVIYNLGVVDDLTTSDKIPEAKVDGTCAGISFNSILFLLSLIILLIILAPILPYIFSLIITLISLPFKLIGILIKKIKKDGSSHGKKK